MFEFHHSFRDLIVREPIISLVEEVLGTECHVVAQNALRTERGNGIVNWHIDDHLFFPLRQDEEQHPSSWRIPCHVINVMCALTATETLNHGPTQVVPRSHYSGRIPEPDHTPEFDGERPISIFARPGDVYLLNNQVWHRGAQNESDRIRFVATTTYGRRFVAQRFYPFLNYRVPDHVLEGADARLLRLLGKHDKGPYG
jgi:ectoine hydroxylase-related dioxygenase (phytanoyl-CoA dioxygenase family)